MNRMNRSTLSLLLLCSWVLAPKGPARAESAPSQETPPENSWLKIDSQYTTFLIHPSLVPAAVDRRVDVFGIPSHEISRQAPADPKERLAAKGDLLFRRVREVLQMYPKQKKVTIRVEKDPVNLQAAHHARYGRGTRAIAFYVMEEDTIYVTAGNLSESVLAHEMAHCVVDHFFGARPPPNVEELVAVYADENLRNTEAP